MIWDTDDNFGQEGIVMRYRQITPGRVGKSELLPPISVVGYRSQSDAMTHSMPTYATARMRPQLRRRRQKV